MKLKNTLIVSPLLIGMCFNTDAQSLCPANIDFETGTTADWTYYKGTVASGPVFSLSSTSPVPTLHTITSGSGVDAYGGFPIVGNGLYSLKLGKDTVNYNSDGASYYVDIPTTGIYSLVYHYAAVLENPGHPASIQPRLVINAYDSATAAAIPGAAHTVTTADPGFIHSSVSPGDVDYKDWTTGVINLAGYGGHTVMIKFIAADCGTGGHFGYAYVDMNCLFVRATAIPCNSTSTSLTAPAGYATYKWMDSLSFTSTYGTTQTITATTPTTYAIIATPVSGTPDTFYTTMLAPVSLPPITGASTVAVAHTITLSDPVTGGTWSSGNTTIATISSSGVVTGVAAGTDTIFYSVGGGVCDAYSVITVTSPLNATTLHTGAGTINLFPNPAKNLLNITWQNLNNDHADIVITDVTGRELYKSILAINATTGQTQIGLSNFCNGIYIVTIRSGDTYFCGKLAVQH